MTKQTKALYLGYNSKENKYQFDVKDNLIKLDCVKQEVKDILNKVTEDEFNERRAFFMIVTNPGNNGQVFLNEVVKVDSKQKTLDVKPKKKPLTKAQKEEVEKQISEAEAVINGSFDKLYNLDCKTFKKDKFTYISWATCWKEIKQHDPKATFKTYCAEDGYPAWIKKGIGSFVKVGVTIDGIEYIECYAVTNSNNHSMIEKEYDKQYKNKGGVVTSTFHVDKISSFDINYAIKRALVKACSYAGFGLKLYNKEDLGE